ncbi:hypothetical protein [Hydrogenimonas sp.]
MKNVETVLDHLLSQPIYATLRQQRCFRLIKKALPQSLQRGILFLYVKNGTLFFALKHPAFKMEFDYKLSLIKNLLTTLPPLKEACGSHEIRDVRAFVSRFAPTPKESGDTVPRYRERADGSFRIASRKEEIKKEFEALKETIRCSKR